jgi:hypothetical protein
VKHRRWIIGHRGKGHAHALRAVANLNFDRVCVKRKSDDNNKGAKAHPKSDKNASSLHIPSPLATPAEHIETDQKSK